MTSHDGPGRDLPAKIRHLEKPASAQAGGIEMPPARESFSPELTRRVDPRRRSPLIHAYSAS